MEKYNKAISLKLTPETDKKLRAYAKEHNRSINNTVNTILENFFNHKYDPSAYDKLVDSLINLH